VSPEGKQDQLDIRLFGGLEISLGGASMGSNVTGRAKSLLAFLAVEADRPHPREYLAEMFWPERPQGTGRNNLRQVLLALRLSLGDKNSDRPFLLPTADEIQFNIDSRFYLDTREFERLIRASLNHDHESLQACADCEDRLQRAVSCYRDDFLRDASLPDAPEFDSWVASKRESYRRDLSKALRAIISMHEDRNEYREGSGIARKLVELEPWDEANHRLLMRSLALAGMRSAALKQYQTCKRVLAAEFDVEPSSETTELYNAIRNERLAEFRLESATRLEVDAPDEPRSDSVPEGDRGLGRIRPWQWGTMLAVLGAGALILLGGSLFRGADLLDDGENSPISGGSDTEPASGAALDSAPPMESGDTPISEDQGLNPAIPSDGEILGRDPHALLPSEACAPGERLLYLEDFQDGEALEWAAIEFRAQGWDIAPEPDSPGNMVALRPGAPDGASAELRDYPLDNAVWRVRFRNHGMVLTNFLWQTSGGYEVDGVRVEYSSYVLETNPQGFILVERDQDPLSYIRFLEVSVNLSMDIWHTLEISSYEGVTEIWLNGNRLVTYQDPKPLPNGKLALIVAESTDVESIAYFDDLSICELTAAFVPMLTPDP